MRSKLRSLFNWRRVLRVSAGIAVAGGTVSGIATVSLAAASCYSINRVRPRTYTDDYHLNPEILHMPYRNIEFSAEDGVNLKGWWIPATVNGRESNRIVVLMHPYNNHKSNLLGVASSLWYHGYSVFMFDFRSFTSNPKTRQTIGCLEQKDAAAAVNYVINNYYYNYNKPQQKRKQMVLMGASMGGATAICVSKEFMKRNIISAIVTDCTFSSLRELCKYRIGVASALWFPTGLLDSVVNIMDFFNQFIYGYTIDDCNPTDIVNDDHFNIPLLLIHSQNDAAVPPFHSQKLYSKCKSKIKNLYLIKSGDHCGGYFINPNLFTKYLCHWVDDVLDHELLQKQQMYSLNDDNQNDDDVVSINNDYIMFETSDDIGVDEEEEKQLLNDKNNNINDLVMNNENNQTIVQGLNDNSGHTLTAKSSEGTRSYFGGFWKK